VFEKRINKLFPYTTAEEWDNIGLQIAGDNIIIKKVLLTLDLNLQVLEYAKTHNFGLIISHHPLIYKAISNIIAYDDHKSYIIRELLMANIAFIVLHTNLDKYFYDLLSKKLNLKNIKAFSDEGWGSYGKLAHPVPLKKFIQEVKKKLHIRNVRYTGADNKIIRSVACIGGSGGVFINKQLSQKKIDVLLTADIKYHTAQMADDLGISVIDAGHYQTENIMMDELKNKLEKAFKNKVKFEKSSIKTDPIKYD